MGFVHGLTRPTTKSDKLSGMPISRRRFLETATIAPLAAGTLHAAADGPGNTPLPTRVFGKTGQRVSILAMGGGSRFLMYKEEDTAIAAIHRALELGITYFDTAYSYGNGVSETRVGKGLAGNRQKVWLTTKIQERDGSRARAILEGSLKRLQTDHVDLCHIHSLGDDDDLARIEARNGVLEMLLRAKSEGLIRNVGITSHTYPAVLRTALERHPFDCTQMALNAALAGMMNGQAGMVVNPALSTSFESVALPVAVRKNLGIIAMKVFAQEFLNDKAPKEDLIRYSLSLPVSLCVIGMPKIEMIAENVNIVKAFRPMPEPEMKKLSTSLALTHKARLDTFFASHIDA
jgi:predicted aldo/keto reductase-like oxidoreductase